MMFWARRSASLARRGAMAFSIIAMVIAAVLYLIAALVGLPRFAYPDPFLLYTAVAAAGLIAARRVDRMPLDWLGLGAHPWTMREIGIGALLGMLGATIAWAPSAVTGSIVAGEPEGERLIGTAALIAFYAIGEELLFRGYLYQRGIEMLGAPAATLLSSLIFTVAHANNPSIGPLGFLSIFLAGLLFCALYLKSLSLWVPIAAHISWNLALATLYGSASSGMISLDSVFRTVPGGPAWLDGGAFGPEGGIAGLLGLLAIATVAGTARSIQPAPWVVARITRGLVEQGERSR